MRILGRSGRALAASDADVVDALEHDDVLRARAGRARRGSNRASALTPAPSQSNPIAGDSLIQHAERGSSERPAAVRTRRANGCFVFGVDTAPSDDRIAEREPRHRPVRTPRPPRAPEKYHCLGRRAATRGDPPRRRDCLPPRCSSSGARPGASSAATSTPRYRRADRDSTARSAAAGTVSENRIAQDHCSGGDERRRLAPEGQRANPDFVLDWPRPLSRKCDVALRQSPAARSRTLLLSTTAQAIAAKRHVHESAEASDS